MACLTCQLRQGWYWLYIVTNWNAAPRLTAVKDPARLQWQEITRIQHYVMATTGINAAAEGL